MNSPAPVIQPIRTQEAFNSLCRDIAEHNSQFSIGFGLARAVRDHLAPQPPAEALSQSERQTNSIQSINAQHANFLREAGLTVTTGATNFSRRIEPGRADSGVSKVELHVANKSAFIAFLNSVTPAMLAQAEFAENLATLPSQLVARVQAAYASGNPGDGDLDLLTSLGAAVKAFESLGLGQACTGLKVYANRLAEGVLVEYIDLQKQGLLIPTGTGFGPGDLQHESTHYVVKERWEKAFTTLDKLGSEERTKGLQQEVGLHLEAMVSSAREKASKPPHADNSELNRVLLNAHKRLWPFALDLRPISSEHASTLDGALLSLQRETQPALLTAGNVFKSELANPDSVGLAAYHRRSGDLIAYACARESGQIAEADIVCLGVSPKLSGLGTEAQILSTLQPILKEAGYVALRIELRDSDPNTRLLLEAYAQRTTVVNKILGNSFDEHRSIVRIAL